MDNYTVSTHFDDFDIDVIHDVLSNSYWSKGIPKETLVRAIKNSLCFAALTADGEQMGFARMITDRATFAYLADVFVVEAHQGKGISRLILDSIAHHPELKGLRRIMLATRDAQGLYKKYGFEEIENPEIFMQRWDPDVYKGNVYKDNID
ncbi:GNAT family N-acetyltransferase [Enterovibrio norvegicus]|uniref:GNAT family N-acetyltransferase n=1 Tax=Enterovibrio norvegicus TaxID=188144 RepID=A0ABV4L195_9GAMM|nr:GNAT family N-acetyltransferase [Enterovibrio norvegicus]OEF49792.1 GNAT family N-acetyltransferase [Enterovibrio norvegicus]OEF60214.1 GNAT family N-acetyltransferase [Enterovibrio norvegicus]PMI27686.1 GNAT family N-acetyltransferase [Enterovibrio norvegicus]TKF18825.1 GNAT family N-acetyltransferase [Enterovibrio norvegicus]TKF31397.1 GNAT family N-acetyltransferase [Enterovibrio norvegicus]